ncbi:MAG: dTDP-4-dehydrorhamnose 3,5-epimerase [uncultured bacterium]|nr:MAG: dTDP-4-dehydrorhamnose 3,5-epimerase [uncultured bacterium]
MVDASQNITKTSISGVVLMQRPIKTDDRGFFHEIYRKEELKEATGVNFDPVQWSHALSHPGVVRAIHSEMWNKLIYPATGILYAPIVDLRVESPTFGRVEYITIDNTREDSPRQAVFLPKGVGNSVCVLGEEDLHYFYLVDEYWDDSKAKGIAWNDPDLNIKWPLENPILSERDKNNPTLREAFPEKFK